MERLLDISKPEDVQKLSGWTIVKAVFMPENISVMMTVKNAIDEGTVDVVFSPGHSMNVVNNSSIVVNDALSIMSRNTPK